MPERLPYDEAMLSSPIRLKIQDPELKQGRVEMMRANTAVGTLERPWGIEGGFAVVYKFRTKSGRLRALRCFRVSMKPDMHFRYEHIGPYFHDYAPDITAGFKYHEAGIVVKDQANPNGQIYPVVEMDWIEGVTLLERVNELCRGRDRAGLKDLIEQWLDIVNILRTAKIAHGDLAGVNVMVRQDGKLILIDYDGVYIPEFAGMAQVLVGQEDYQHPHMAQRSFDEHMDDFSALVIYTALVVLEANPELWDKYVKLGPDGKPIDVYLLFRQQDFKDPQASSLLQELEHIKDQRVRELVRELTRACLQPIDQARFPYALLDPTRQRKNALQSMRTALQSADIEQIALVYASLQNNASLSEDERRVGELATRFIQAYNNNDDDALVAAYEAIQNYASHSYFSLTLVQNQRVITARERSQALAHLRTALHSKSPLKIADAYDSVLDNSAQVTREEREQVALARTLTQALRSKDENFLIAASMALKQSVHQQFFLLTEEEQQQIEQAQQQRMALLDFRSALNSRNLRQIVAAYTTILDTNKNVQPEERELLAYARSFVQAYDADEDAELLAAGDVLQKPTLAHFFQFTAQEQQRLALAEQRQGALEEFRRVLSAEPKSARALIDAYEAVSLDKGSAVTTTERETLNAAYRYLAMYEAVRTGLRENDDGIIRRAYDPILGKQFADITPLEQKRIDRAMLGQDLEELLENREYGPALRRARALQTANERAITENLAFKLQRATKRFIREHDLTGLTVRIEERADGNHAVVYWKWPLDDLIQHALIAWRIDRWPERPSESSWQDPGWKHVWAWRRQGSQDGMCTFALNGFRHIYVRGYLAILDTWDQEQVWRYSDGNDPSASAEATSPQAV